MTVTPNQLIGITHCEICGSARLASNREGFVVCTNCGVEQSTVNSMPSVKYNERNQPRSHSIMTNLTRTYIGNHYEQQYFSKYRKLDSINRIYQKQYRYEIYRKSYMEILRICSALALPLNFAKDSFTVFKKVWNRLKPGTKARAYKILIPVVIYRTTQMLKFTLSLSKIYEVTEVAPDDIKEVLIATYKMFPKIDKTGDVLRRIDRICDQLEMSGEIRNRAINILKANRRVMLSTINKIAACCAVSMAVISLDLRAEYRIYKIGKVMNASASAIGSRMRKVLASRGLKKHYSATELDEIIPKIYDQLAK